MSAVIRDAIDRGLDVHPDVTFPALDVIFEAEEAHVPSDPDDLVAELHEMRGASLP